MSESIKVKSYAVLLDPVRNRQLVWVSRDAAEHPGTFHRLLGGHVEFGEPSESAIVREIAEEVHVELRDPVLLGVLESVFSYAGEARHEVAFVYASTVDPDLVPDEGAWFDDGGPIRVEWRPVENDGEIPLYPEGTQALIEGWLRTR